MKFFQNDFEVFEIEPSMSLEGDSFQLKNMFSKIEYEEETVVLLKDKEELEKDGSNSK